jgi:hypothetical protein
MAAQDGSKWPTHKNKTRLAKAEKFRVVRLKKLGKITPPKPSEKDLR